VPGCTPGCGFFVDHGCDDPQYLPVLPLIRWVTSRAVSCVEWCSRLPETALSRFQIPETLTYGSGRRQGVRVTRAMKQSSPNDRSRPSTVLYTGPAYLQPIAHATRRPDVRE